MFRSVLVLFSAMLIAPPLHAKDFAPRDECRRLGGSNDFRAKLESAVAERDKDKLLALADEKIMLDFGGGSGQAELATRLDSSDYALWDELEKVLKLGCAVGTDGTIIMPWYFAQDMGQIDPYEGMLVTGTRVALRDAPSLRSRVLKRLSWMPVTVAYQESDPGEFWPVTTLDGQSGFMHRDFLRSFVDYRLLAERKGKDWKITVFIAGD